jgi:predicted aspartyl protease
MVDTGSSYLVINERTLASLKEKGHAEYVKKVSGLMADGSRSIVPIYRIASLSIGCCCLVRDVEAAVLPGSTRQILGLSALRKVAPFALSVEPPSLMLSNCEAGKKTGAFPIDPSF